MSGGSAISSIFLCWLVEQLFGVWGEHVEGQKGKQNWVEGRIGLGQVIEMLRASVTVSHVPFLPRKSNMGLFASEETHCFQFHSIQRANVPEETPAAASGYSSSHFYTSVPLSAGVNRIGLLMSLKFYLRCQ